VSADPGWAGVVALAAMGVALAACAGLRTFLPLLGIGLAARFDLVSLGPGFDWLAGTPALVTLSVAVVLEILADKVPLLDHALDLVGTVAKPIAGGVVAAAPIADFSPLELSIAWIVAGGSLAALVHLGKSGLRVGSTLVTGGLGNPLLSLVEDVAAFVGLVLAFVLPILAALAALAAIAVVAIVRRRRRVAAPAATAEVLRHLTRGTPTLDARR
jgi:hypothetical protein